MMLTFGLELRTGFQLRHDVSTESILESLVRLWETSPHQTIEIGSETVEFVLCDPKHLAAIDGEEHYGIYVGEMTFISTATPERWIPFVAFHEWAERRVDPSVRGVEDESGHAKHWRALYAEIRLANQTLTEDEFDLFMHWRQSVERTRYFELDPEVQDYFDRKKAERPKLPGPMSPWRRRSIVLSGAYHAIGYDATHDLGVSHCDLVLTQLQHSSIPLGDVYAVLASFGFLDLKSEVLIPPDLHAAAFLLSAQITRPVLVLAEKDAGGTYVHHLNGKTRQTVEALMRRLAEAQQIQLVHEFDAAMPGAPKALPGPVAETRRVARMTTEIPKMDRQTKNAILNGLYGKLLIHLLAECETGEDLDGLLSPLDTANAERQKLWLASRGVAVPSHASDVDLLDLSAAKALLEQAGAAIPEEIQLRPYYRPRQLKAVIEANLDLLRRLAREGVIDGHPGHWLAGKTDRGFDAVPWLEFLLLAKNEDANGNERKIVRNGTVDAKLLAYVLDERFKIRLHETDDEEEELMPEEPDEGQKVPVAKYVYLKPSEAKVVLGIADGTITKGLRSMLDRYVDKLLKDLKIIAVDGQRGQAVTTINRTVARMIRFEVYDESKNWRYAEPGDGEMTLESQWYDDLKTIAALEPAPAADQGVDRREDDEPTGSESDASEDDDASPPTGDDEPVTRKDGDREPPASDAAPTPSAPPVPAPVAPPASTEMKDVLLTILAPLLEGVAPEEIADMLSERVVNYAADAIIGEREKNAEIAALGEVIASYDEKFGEIDRQMGELARRRDALSQERNSLVERKHALTVEIPNLPGRELVAKLATRLKAKHDAERELAGLIDNND